MANLEEESKKSVFIVAMPQGAESPVIGILKGHKMQKTQTYPVEEIVGGLILDSYDRGIPHQVLVPVVTFSEDKESKSPSAEPYQKISREVYLDHLNQCLGGIETRIISGLDGACWASRHYFLEGIIENIRRRKAIDELAPELPETGVYVICRATSNDPLRNSLDPSFTELEVLKAPPGFSPQEVVEEIQRKYKDNFGSVIPNIGGLSDEGTNLETLYFAYVVPKRGLPFIEKHLEAIGN